MIHFPDKTPARIISEFHKYSSKYVVKEYPYYRTISKIDFIDGKVDTTQKVDEYVIWVNPTISNAAPEQAV